MIISKRVVLPIAMLCLLTGIANRVEAGLIELPGLKPGSTAGVTALRPGFPLPSVETQSGVVNATGTMIFFFKDQHKILATAYCYQPDGRPRPICFTVEGFDDLTIASLEPFSIPTFEASAGDVVLAAIMDGPRFLMSGITLTSGQSLIAHDGIVDGVPFVTVHDGAGLPNDPVAATLVMLDPAASDNLPKFSGSVTVGFPIHFSPVPEPSSVALCGIALSVLGCTLRKVVA
jgi:hypothetical protein